MVEIEIDEEVFEVLKGRAAPFVDRTPNDVLRRLLLNGKGPGTYGTSQIDDHPSTMVTGTRQQRADLWTLQQRGFLKSGERLHLRDFRGEPVKSAEATVQGRSLKWRGRKYAMSRLATQLLQEQGHRSNHVRGPAHWFTEAGKSVWDLWEDHLHTKRR